MFNFPLWICFPHQISIPTSSGEIVGEPPSEYLVWIDEKDYIIAVYITPRMFYPMQGTEGFNEVFVLFTMRCLPRSIHLSLSRNLNATVLLCHHQILPHFAKFRQKQFLILIVEIDDVEKVREIRLGIKTKIRILNRSCPRLK